MVRGDLYDHPAAALRAVARRIEDAGSLACLVVPRIGRLAAVIAVTGIHAQMPVVDRG